MTFLRPLVQICRAFSTEPLKKFVQVCVLGADTPSGQLATFLLKQNPTVSTLHLQGTSKVEGMGIDLSHFDTRCTVRTYHDMDSVGKSVKSADIIVMMGLDSSTSRMSLARHVMLEAPRVAKLAETCAKYSPKAVVVVAAMPVSVTLPTVAEVYRKTDWYHPGKLLGCAGTAQLKANALAGKFQNLDPQLVQVPLVGGPDVDCAVPLFARTLPVGMSMKDAENLTEIFKEDIPCPVVSQALGVNRMVTGIALGLSGNDNANVLAFVRSSIVNICQHMVCTVKIGKLGVEHNYGLQKLNSTELKMLEESCLELKKREEMARDLVHRRDKCALPAFMIKELEEEKSMQQTGMIR